MLQHRKRENSRENEENSVKTDDLIQIKNFSWKFSRFPKKFPVFCVVTHPPDATNIKNKKLKKNQTINRGCFIRGYIRGY